MEFGFGTHCAQLHRDSLQEGGQSTAFLTPSERPQTGEVFFGTRKEVSMSRKSGDRSRFNRLRKAKLHDRARIRALRTSLGLDGHARQKREAPAIETKARRVSESTPEART